MGRKYSNGKLVSWIDRHCRKCGRFLAKKNKHSVCLICSIKRKLEYIKNWNKKNKDRLNTHRRLRYQINDRGFRTKILKYKRDCYGKKTAL